MEQLLDNIMSLQRDDVVSIGKLGKFNKSKLCDIISKTDYTEHMSLDKCWIWKVHHNEVEKGHMHPSIHYNGKHVKVHRLMFHNFVQNVPIYERSSNAKQVNHLCCHEQNGLCVNPWHCYLGTPKDNMQDALRDKTKNRPPKGEKNWQSKLSDDEVKSVIKLAEEGNMYQKDIAKLYGISQSQISRWLNKVTRNI